jgi:hypothetical protein
MTSTTPQIIIEVARSNASFFANSLSNDALIRPMMGFQRILVGTQSNALSAIMVSSNVTQITSPCVYLSSNLGIGISNPNYNLDIVGDINFTGYLRNNGNLYTTSQSQWQSQSSNIYIMGSNVGIGTSNPTGAMLHVVGGSLRQQLNNNIGTGLMLGSFGSTTGNRVEIYDELLANNLGPRIYFGAANTSLINSGGNFAILPSNNLGVGTSNPVYKLDVAGDINFTGTLRQNGSSIGSQFSQWITNGTTIYYNGGNVGIGTSSPSSILDVNGSMTVRSGNSTNSFISNQLLFGWQNTDTFRHAIKTRHNSGANDFNNAIDFFIWQISDTSSNVGSKHLMSITSLGVGINTTNPTQTLSVNGNILGISDNAAFGFDSQPNARFGIVKQYGVLPTIASSSGNPILFGNLNSSDIFTNIGTSTLTEQMRITPTGNVGIGTSTPGYKLDVAGNMRIQNVLWMNNQEQNCVISLWGDAAVNSTNYYGFGINASTLRYQVPSSGTTHRFYAGTTQIAYIHGDGNLWAAGSITGSSKNFEINHPLIEDKKLVHAAIEGPRYDLIYRGTVKLQNGQAVVNIDRECVHEEDCAMTPGTFEALCRNPVKYVHNNDSFSRVRATITGGLLNIFCEDPNSCDSVDWIVIAERKDENIRQSQFTNDNGYLRTEKSK